MSALISLVSPSLISYRIPHDARPTLGLRNQRICRVNQFLHAAYSCEMPESLFATFPSLDTFSQHLYSEVAAKFLAVLEAVSDCLCRAVNSNRNAINSYILDSLCQCLAGSINIGSPKSGKVSGENVTISVIKPSSIRRTSSASARQVESPGWHT